MKEINKKHLKVHVMVEAERQVKQDYIKQLVRKQRELLMQFGEQPDECLDDIEIDPEVIEVKFDSHSEKLMEDIEKKQAQQLRNIEKLNQVLLDYVRTQKLRSTIAVTLNELLKPKVGEKVWPTPNDLSELSADQMQDLKVCSLLIIQKNSQRSRGEQWGHAFFLRLKLDQGIESPLLGQDEWENDPSKRPELSEYSMRDLNKIVVSYKEGMVVGMFFYVKN